MIQSLQDQQPYQAAYQNDLKWMGAAMVKHYHGDDSDLKLLMGAVTAAFDTVSVEAYDQLVCRSSSEADHPRPGAAVSDRGYHTHGGAAALPGGQRLSPTTSPRAVIGTSCGRSLGTFTGSRPSG